ncbi:hypothetical protein BN938_1034 [Mucinivorans hirudinis]|uniref:Uncharacterized protein n=1 Tax=Mucinivorans hirudinis TaxID=1433126 RepID=A0A060R7B3_9BACT|nr:hypothetical protein BN938_1034 [Mucinivorans hirudinis]
MIQKLFRITTLLLTAIMSLSALLAIYSTTLGANRRWLNFAYGAVMVMLAVIVFRRGSKRAGWFAMLSMVVCLVLFSGMLLAVVSRVLGEGFPLLD